MDYKIGDIVVKKPKTQYTEKYIFLGIVDGDSVRIVREVKYVMGLDVEIGAFVRKPFTVEETDDWGYRVPVMFSNVELYEKE